MNADTGRAKPNHVILYGLLGCEQHVANLGARVAAVIEANLLRLRYQNILFGHG